MSKNLIINQVLKAREKRIFFLEEMKKRQEIGREIAEKCAFILKEKFGAKKVFLFGSLLNYQEMNYDSDIDLAVLGLPEHQFWLAGALLEKNHDFEIDLVEIEKAKPYILKAIEKGIEL